MGQATILDKIVTRKREEVVQAKKQRSLQTLESLIQESSAVRGFQGAVGDRAYRRCAAVIAEIKKASPSKGVIRSDFKPAEIAQQYQAKGAACLSVLTDRDFFQGDSTYLKAAREACELPVLRKDFMIEPYQIVESRAMEADCILLIAACLSNAQLKEMHQLANDLGMDALVEVHSADEMERALSLGCPFIGVNNRNLHTFEVNIHTTIELLSMTQGSDVQLVTESGIHTKDDVETMIKQGVYAFLVGEAFMRQPDPGIALSDLFGSYL